MKKPDAQPEIIMSARSRLFEKDGHHVEVYIYQLAGGSMWTLEVVEPHGAATTWDDKFSSDEDAWNAFVKAIEEEGIEHLVAPIERRTFH